MKGIIKCSWYYGRTIILYKIIFQGIIMAFGLTFTSFFHRIIDAEACIEINQIFYAIILLLSIDLYMQLYDKTQKTKLDRFISATPLGFRRYNDGMFLFDFLFLIFSFGMALAYVAFSNIIAEIKIINWRSLIEIFIFYAIIKIILIIIMNIIGDTKSTILTAIILSMVLTKYTTVIENMKLGNMNLYIAVIILLLLYIALGNLFEKLWKRKN